MKLLMRPVYAVAMIAMLAVPAIRLAAVQSPEEPKCGYGDKVLCVSIRYCFFWCWTKEHYAGEKVSATETGE